MPADPLPLLSIESVCYTPGGTRALHDVTLRSDARRIGIVGRNGSGKTTLARIIAGLVTPDQGRVRLAGINVAEDRKAALGIVGILFQNPDHQIIFPTVEEETAFGLRQMGQSELEAARGVAAILARFNKGHWAKEAIHRLSQGQRQLVCLMAILAMQPRVIILDEPYSGLDIPTAKHLHRLLAGLDATLIHITHDPGVLKHFDHILWLEGGEVAQQGPPDTVLSAFNVRMQEIGDCDDLSDLAS
jgi:biotin transport system ATP-binding protein